MAWVVKRYKLNSKKCVLWDTLFSTTVYEYLIYYYYWHPAPDPWQWRPEKKDSKDLEKKHLKTTNLQAETEFDNPNVTSTSRIFLNELALPSMLAKRNDQLPQFFIQPKKNMQTCHCHRGKRWITSALGEWSKGKSKTCLQREGVSSKVSEEGGWRSGMARSNCFDQRSWGQGKRSIPESQWFICKVAFSPGYRLHLPSSCWNTEHSQYPHTTSLYLIPWNSEELFT